MIVYIKITGNGTLLEIVDALSGVQKSLLAATPEDLDGAEWEDKTLMTEVNVDLENESGPFDQLGYEQTTEE